MQLSTVILHVSDNAALDACRDWYTNLGLTPSSYTPDESAFFDTGDGTSLGIHIEDDAGPGATVYLRVVDVDKEYDRLLAASIDAEDSPADRFWGRVLYLRDPAGHRIGLVAPTE